MQCICEFTDKGREPVPVSGSDIFKIQIQAIQLIQPDEPHKLPGRPLPPGRILQQRMRNCGVKAAVRHERPYFHAGFFRGPHIVHIRDSNAAHLAFCTGNRKPARRNDIHPRGPSREGEPLFLRLRLLPHQTYLFLCHLSRRLLRQPCRLHRHRPQQSHEQHYGHSDSYHAQIPPENQIKTTQSICFYYNASIQDFAK